MKHRLATSFVAVILFAGPLKAQGNQVTDFHRVVTSKGSSWQDQENAFYDLLKSVPASDGGVHPWSTLPAILSAQPDSGKALRTDLIQALSNETVWARTQSSLTEEFTSYDGDLIAAVTSLRDPRSIDVLFERIDSGNMALNALASFGDPALDRALAIVETNGKLSHAAVMLLSKLSQPENLNNLRGPASKTKLRDTLIRSLKINDYFVQSTAIRGLVQLGDKAAIPALSEVAQTGVVVSVRQEASEAKNKLSVR